MVDYNRKWVRKWIVNIFLVKLINCARSGGASELDGLEMVARDCGSDQAQDLIMVSGCCRVKVMAVHAKEVKEWEKSWCWTDASFFY